jgi:hypothetical protein
MGDWLVRDSTFIGIHFQNWMPMVAGLALLFVLYLWARRQ